MLEPYRTRRHGRTMRKNDRTAAEKEKKKRGRTTALFALLNIAVIGCAALRERGGANGSGAFALGRYGWLWMLGGFGCLALSYAMETAKYLLMMRALGGRVSPCAAFETAALGRYYDSITPSGAGGQPFQIWWLHRRAYDDGAAGAMPVVGFLTMQAGFILPAFLTFLLCRADGVGAMRGAAWLGLCFFSFAPGLLTWFSVAPRAAERFCAGVFRLGAKLRLVKDADAAREKLLATLEQYHGSFEALAGRRGLCAALMLLSILYRLALCSIPWFVLRALGASVPYGSALALTFYICAASTLIPTPGNAGAAEGSFYLVFSAVGAAGVFWAMLLWRVLCYYSVILIGAIVQVVGTREEREAATEALRGAA